MTVASTPPVLAAVYLSVFVLGSTPPSAMENAPLGPELLLLAASRVHLSVVPVSKSSLNQGVKT